MLRRLPAALSLAVMTLLLGMIGGLPGPVAPAGADPTTVTVAAEEIAPFVMTTGAARSGFTIEILDEIAARRGWTITYLAGNTEAAVLDEVTVGRADAAVGAIGITSERVGNFDFSQPVYNGGLQILVPDSGTGGLLPGLREFLDVLFSRAVLGWVAGALAIALIPAHVTWLLERRHPDSIVSRNYFPGIVQAVGWSLGMLATQPDNFPRQWGARTLGLVLAFVSIIFVALFTATLTANLTVSTINSQIATPSDLVGKSVCTVAATSAADYLGEIGADPVAKPSIDECFAGLKRRDFAAVVFDAPVLNHWVNNDGAGTAQVVGPVFEREDYGVAFSRGSALRVQFDESLLEMREDGAYDLIKQKWFGSDGSSSAGSS
jgi:polar amino acid transport system substrate-binding protein